MTDIELAKNALSGHSIALCRNGEVITDDGRGISPMMKFIAEGRELSGYSAADVIVGKAAATVACKTALKYRYKPTLRYSVEVYGAGNKRAGELRVTVRTQSEQLYSDLSGFFRCWTALEQKYIADRLSQDIMFAIEPGRFTRTLNMPPEGISDEELGQAVADYMAALDEAMKHYFSKLPDTEHAKAAAESSYRASIVRQKVII